MIANTATIRATVANIATHATAFLLLHSTPPAVYSPPPKMRFALSKTAVPVFYQEPYRQCLHAPATGLWVGTQILMTKTLDGTMMPQ
jgi:hypothetical protein